MAILLAIESVIAALNLAIGAYVVRTNPKSFMHWAFFVITFGIAAWMLSMVALIITGSFPFAVIAFWGGELTVIGFMVFGNTFPDGRRPSLSFAYWLPWIILVPLTASHWILAGAAFNAKGYLVAKHGPLFLGFTIVMVGYVALSLRNLAGTFRKSEGIRNVQVRYFLLGASLFLCGAVICNVVLPAFGNSTFNLVGPLCSIFFVSCTAYAIIRFELLDIQVVIKRGIAYFSALAAVAIIFFSFEFVVEKFFYRNDEVVDIAASIIGALVFFQLKNFFEKITDAIFFRADYDYAVAIHDLGPILNSTIELEAVLKGLDGFLARTIKPSTVVFVIHHRERTQAPTVFIHDTSIKAFDPSILAHAAAHTIVIMQIAALQEERYRDDPLYIAAKHSRMAAAIPLLAQGAVVGTLFIGNKMSDGILRPKDIDLLSVISHQAGIAIENARLYESIRQHNEKLEETVLERTREIKEMYRTQEQFITDISHQLQTPIAILDGNLELAGKQPAAEARRLMRSMREVLDGMRHLVSNFLEIARLNFSKNAFEKNRLDIGALLDETYNDCVVLAETKNIEMSCLAESVLVTGDRRKLKEVILNLISNALKHTESKGKIFLTAAKFGSIAVIKVRDTGSGISPENIAHIFERFYRIPGDRASGTGLGLNICREIVERHGGTIAAQSALGEGSTFTIVLPLVHEPDDVASGIL
ncbi:MAG TPA: ATP-binding protein [Candidatus Paceibacterota bacterium]|nr:ATP-binding protein [Candidatus Paceibacterota bacterium]